MQLRPVVLVLAMVLVGSGASAEVVRVGDLNTLMAANPSYQEWIASAGDRDRAIGEKQQSWNARRTEDAKGNAAAEFAALETAWNRAHLGNVDIAASPDAVFAYVADAPGRASTFIASLNRIHNISPERPGVE